MKYKVLIVGYGIASTAYASVLNSKKIKTSVIGSPYDKKIIQKLKKDKNDKINRIKFNSNFNFYYEKEIYKLKKNEFDLIIVGTNSKGLDWAIKLLNYLMKQAPVLLITKGLFKNQNKIITFSNLFEKKCFNKKIIMASGPCLAKELIYKNHTRTVFASKNLKNAKIAKKILETDYYHPDISSDIKGAEICSAIKNIYATVVGSSVPKINLKKNTKASLFNPSSALFEQSLKEMNIIVKNFGGKNETVGGLSGAGDLYVSILGGRNSKLGFYLGQGFSYKSIINKQLKGITVEGADLIILAGRLILKKISKKKLPLLFSLTNSILSNKRLKIDWKMFTQ